MKRQKQTMFYKMSTTSNNAALITAYPLRRTSRTRYIQHTYTHLAKFTEFSYVYDFHAYMLL